MNPFDEHYKICAISDLHVSTPNCQYDKLWYFLDNIKTDKLVMVGDCLDVTHGNLRKYHNEVSKFFHKLAKLSETTKIIWIFGNHEGPWHHKNDYIPQFILMNQKITLVFDKEIDYTNSIVYTHGHFYSVYSSGYWRKFLNLSYDLISPLNRLLKKVFNYDLIGHLKNTPNAKTFITNFKYSLLNRLRDEGRKTIVTGHIHNACIYKAPDNSLYINCGDFIDSCSFISFNGNDWRINYV